jgi:hypothetical protein
MEGLDRAVQVLARTAQRPRQPVEFNPIAVASEAPPCAAVDGSSGVLADNGTAWVVAVRAAGVHWPGPAKPEVQPRIVATAPADAEAVTDAAFARHALEGPAARSAESFAEALRSVAELEAALAAVAALPPGGLLLVDGALRALPPGPAAIAGRIEEACRQRGVRIAGVAKRSGIEGAGVPLIPALLAEAQARGVAGPWVVTAGGGVHVAKLHAAAQHAFRIDADPDLLPVLAALARDAVYTGYPYPLALAHNRVALTGSHLRELRERLDLGLRRAGAATAARDFHAVLDENVPG